MTVDHGQVDTDGELFRLSVAQYHAMRDAGILDEDDRVELLDGLLVPKLTKHPPHSQSTWLVRAALERVAPADHFVNSRDAITTADSEPEPDVLLVRGSIRDYADRHPGPSEVSLIVEIADTTLRRDRGVKRKIYARAGIEHYWIVDLNARVVLSFSEPAGSRFATEDTYADGSEIPLVMGGIEIARIPVASLLPVRPGGGSQ